MEKRSSSEIYVDILVAVQYEIQKNCSARTDRVLEKISIPHGRFREYIENLRRNSLIKVSKVGDDEEIKLTGKGVEYIMEYKRVGRFLTAFGLKEKHNDLL